jgi:hypothetical protein
MAVDFFLWGFIKDYVYQPPLPAHHQELNDWIIVAIVIVNQACCSEYVAGISDVSLVVVVLKRYNQSMFTKT